MNERLNWRKSSYSDGHGGNCVEVANPANAVLVRDSQHPHLGHLEVPLTEWQAFVAAMRTEEL